MAESRQSQLVVGLDPRIDLLPEGLVADKSARHGHTPRAAADAFVEFNRAVIDSVLDLAVAVKPQIAFYESWGMEGLRAYAETIAYARSQGLIVIADVKRNDIGSTADAYARGHLAGPSDAQMEPWAEAMDFHADAITVNALLGSDGAQPFIERAAGGAGGVFVLVRTSNKSSAELQELDCGGHPLYQRIAELVERWGEPFRGTCGYSLVGAVAGATFPKALAELRRAMPHAILLVPGVGAQGATVADVVGAFDEQGRGAVVNSSRGIIYAFRTEENARRYGPEGWREAIRDAAERMRSELWAATHG